MIKSEGSSEDQQVGQGEQMSPGRRKFLCFKEQQGSCSSHGGMRRGEGIMRRGEGGLRKGKGVRRTSIGQPVKGL